MHKMCAAGPLVYHQVGRLERCKSDTSVAGYREKELHTDMQSLSSVSAASCVS